MLPPGDPELATATWLGYVEHDRPVAGLSDILDPYYVLHLGSFDQTDRPAGFAETGNRLAEYLMVLFLWEKLPDDLLRMFWQSAPEACRRHAMWFMGREMASGRKFRSRAMAYWEARLRCAIEANDPEPYRRELGTISALFRWDVDRLWLLEQLKTMLEAGFAPPDAFGLVESLSAMLPEHVDAIVEVTDALVRQPKVDGWIFAAQGASLRQILVAGKKSPSPNTVATVKDIVSYLASRGNTGFLDLDE